MLMPDEIINAMSDGKQRPKMLTESGKYLYDVYDFMRWMGLDGKELEQAMLAYLGVYISEK